MAGHVDGSKASHPRIIDRACRVSLTMIVRDEEANLPRALESARGLFDEIVVVDTGSRDQTREIARSFGAVVFDVTWQECFASARNAALVRASGEYAFWLDADEFIDPSSRPAIQHLLDTLQPGGRDAYTMRFFGTGIPEPGIYQDRLFPRRPDIRWICRIHEAIWPALRRAGVSSRPSGAGVHHKGYADGAVCTRKRARNERILRTWLSESPEDAFALWHLGRLAAARGEWAAALDLYRRGLAEWPADLMPDAPRAYIAQAEWELGRHRAALQTCSDSLALSPHHAPAWFARGRMHDVLGERHEAERCWRHILALVGGDPRWMAYSDPHYEASRARRALASLALARGDVDAAARLNQEAVANFPDRREPGAWSGVLDVERDAGPRSAP